MNIDDKKCIQTGFVDKTCFIYVMFSKVGPFTGK